MLIDTHKAIEKMIAVGNTKENAEVIVEIINSQNNNLVTKTDLKLGLSEVKSALRAEIHEIRSDVEKVDLKIDSVRSEVGTIKWMIGLLFALNLTIIGLVLSVKISMG
jgi:enoyl reductase-like protein